MCHVGLGVSESSLLISTNIIYYLDYRFSEMELNMKPEKLSFKSVSRKLIWTNSCFSSMYYYVTKSILVTWTHNKLELIR